MLRNRIRRTLLKVTLAAVAAVPLLSPAAVDYRLVKIKKGVPLRTSLDEAVEAELAGMREHNSWSKIDEQRIRESIRTRVKNESEGYRMEGMLSVDYSKNGSVVSVTIANVSNLRSSDVMTEVFDGKVTLRYWKRMRTPKLVAGDEREQFCRLADMIVLGDYMPPDATVAATVQRRGVTTTRYLWRRGRGKPYYTEVDRANEDGRPLAARSYSWGPILGTPVVTYLVREWTGDTGKRMPKVIEIQSGPKDLGVVFMLAREKSGAFATTDLSKHLRKGETVIDMRGGGGRQTNFDWMGALPPVSGGSETTSILGLLPYIFGLVGGAAAFLIAMRLRAARSAS